MDDLTDKDINEVTKKFWGSTLSHLKNAETISRLAGTGVIIFGLIATVGGIAASSPSNLTTWSASTVGIWGAGLAVICAAIQKILEKDHIELIQQAKVSLDRAQAYLYRRSELKRQIEDMEDLDKQRYQLHSTFVYMLEHTEQLIAANPSPPIKTAIDGLFDICQAELLASMAMTYADKMTISVYKVVKNSASEDAHLEILSNRKPNKAEEQDYVSRSWKKGEGYSGQAWMLANEVVVPDTTTLPASLHTSKLGEQANGDPNKEIERYKSVASVPIFVGPENTIWGVVSVTTNQPNKFSINSSDDAAAQNVETVRILAKMIAVLVACCDTINGEEPPSAADESEGNDETV